MFESIVDKSELLNITDTIVTCIDETDSIQSLKDRLSEVNLYNPTTQMLAESIGNMDYNPFANNKSLAQFRKDVLKAQGTEDPEVQSLKETITIKDGEIDVFTTQIQGLKKKLADLQDNYDRVTVEKDEYKKDLDVANQNYDKLSAESERVLDSLKETTAKQLEDYKEKTTAQSVEIDNLLRETKALQTTNTNYKQSLANVQSQLTATQEELNKATESANAWYQAYQQLEAGQGDIVTRYLLEQFNIDLNSGTPLIDQMKSYIAKADNLLA